MKILAIDMGTGTQDILLFDSAGPVENSVKMVMPSDTVTMSIELITPIALEAQMRFAIREGGKTIGASVVTKIVELVAASFGFRRVIPAVSGFPFTQ